MIRRFSRKPNQFCFEVQDHASIYNGAMARGWESKAVEQQQDEAARSSTAGPRLSPEQAAHSRQRQGLQLSRKRVLDQLATAHDPRHRKMLEDALAELDRQIECSTDE